MYTHTHARTYQQRRSLKPCIAKPHALHTGLCKSSCANSSASRYLPGHNGHHPRGHHSLGKERGVFPTSMVRHAVWFQNGLYAIWYVSKIDCTPCVWNGAWCVSKVVCTPGRQSSTHAWCACVVWYAKVHAVARARAKNVHQFSTWKHVQPTLPVLPCWL